MKKILLFLSIAFFLFSCESDPDFFTVSGEIANANGEKLYLVELQTNNINILDSVVLNEYGTFSFKGQTDIPRFYAIRTSSNNYLTLIINNLEQINIKANSDELYRDAVITGSPASNNILILRTKLENSIQSLDSLALKYQSLLGTRELKRVKDSLGLVSQEIIEKHTEFSKKFVTDNLNSLAGLMALYQQIAPRRYVLNPKDNFEYFNLVDSSLMSIIPESDAVKALHAQLKEYKRQDNAVNILGIGKIAPDIALPNPKGDTISLYSLRGKYVLLDFWASWCRPCRVENPNLVRTYKKYNAKGFEIFQVSLDKKKQSWEEAINKDNLEWSNVSDLKYWSSAPAQLYKIQSIPTNFLIDKQGKIIAKNLKGDALEAKLSELFN